MSEINRQRLIDIRQNHGYSQKYVALSIGVAPSIVSRWESGKKVPSRESVSKLADLYEVTIDYLMGRSDEEMPISADSLSDDELKLIQDYRKLNKQGQEYIRQTMYMALPIYKRHSDNADMEDQKIG